MIMMVSDFVSSLKYTYALQLLEVTLCITSILCMHLIYILFIEHTNLLC